MAKERCSMQKRTCKVHGFVHGNEAEQLRKGIEKIIADPQAHGFYENDGRVDLDEVLHALQRLLDRTDAHDSLAFLENQDAA